jgi:SOS-response transcriptional repressor LexA
MCSDINYAPQGGIVANMETDGAKGLRYDYGVMEIPMKEWVQRALEKSGLSQAALARAMSEQIGRSIDRAAVNKITKGTRMLSYDEIVAIVRITGIDFPDNDIGRVVSDMREHSRKAWSRSAGLDVDGFDQTQLDRLPVRGEVAAGRWLETAAFLDWSEISEYIDGVAVSDTQRPYTYGLRVRGTSINKIANEGDVLVCLDLSSGIEIVERDVVIVERIRDQGSLREVTAKRVSHKGGKIVLLPESTDPMWQTAITIDDDPQDDSEVRLVAKVKHVIRTI